MNDDASMMVLYAVRNKNGQYFRAKGFGGGGDTWVDELRKARIYPRIGPARATVTYFALHHPSFCVPDLVELHITKVVAVQEVDRVKKSAQKKEEQAARWHAKQAQIDLARAEQKKREADDELERLRRAALRADTNKILRMADAAAVRKTSGGV